MKKYFADILTFTRIILATTLIVVAIIGDNPGYNSVAFVLFVVGELTDAFDGTCAMRWPFPKDKTLKYRKYAAVYDMVADAVLVA